MGPNCWFVPCSHPATSVTLEDVGSEDGASNIPSLEFGGWFVRSIVTIVLLSDLEGDKEELYREEAAMLLIDSQLKLPIYIKRIW